MAVYLNDKDPLRRQEAAMEAVNEMLMEEGVEFVPEKCHYIDEYGMIIDLDIEKIVKEYLEHLDKAQVEQNFEEKHRDYFNVAIQPDQISRS